MDRREFLRRTGYAISIPLANGTNTLLSEDKLVTQKNSTVFKRKAGSLSWLDDAEPREQAGTTFGHPWSQGELLVDAPVQLLSQNGQNIPLQTWPTAYWPDGSIKWTAHAIPKGVKLGKTFSIKQGKPAKSANEINAKLHNNSININNGVIAVNIVRNGKHIIESIQRNNKVIAKHAKLIGLLQDKPESNHESPAKVISFESDIKQALIEQNGPIRTVVKIEGVHKTSEQREWLPFTLRLYFYANSESIKITHSFIFDGNAEQDFIRGLGLRFNVLQKDELYNRHIRFVGQNKGLWAEAVKGITGLRRDPGQAVKNAQIAGLATPPLKDWDERVSSRMHWIPAWGDFTLTQLSANGFSIRKRTKKGHGWIDADQGQRASGAAYLGGVSGGVMFGMRDFWQLHPVQLDIRNAETELSEATIWFYSPEAPAMDVRFYHDGLGQKTYDDQLDALNITYEDYEPGFGDAHGIARTTDFTLCITESTPSREQTLGFSDNLKLPATIVAAPEDYLQTGVFGGLWSLPKRNNAELNKIEDRLQWQIEFYKQQIDQRHWYGFWNFGDVMHAYDVDRHVWRYDIGGYAWDNSELSPDLWLWYSFLRTGDATTFRLAENMTRHNRDVDIYHTGRFKGLGTRHNVQHWGCSAKQLRISTAAYRRFHYFISGDERTGDVLNEVINADTALAELNATRKVAPLNRSDGLATMGVGTDWGSVAANWLTAWERTGNPKYKSRLTNAMKVIGSHPLGFFAGSFAYNTNTKELVPNNVSEPSLSHLSSVFGLIEISTELNQLLDVPEYLAAWLRYGRLYSASSKEQEKELGKAMRGNSLIVAHSRLTAYVSKLEDDPKLAKRAWKEFNKKWARPAKIDTQRIEGPAVLNPIDESEWISTNEAAQWGLAAIQNLSMIEKWIDK